MTWWSIVSSLGHGPLLVLLGQSSSPALTSVKQNLKSKTSGWGSNGNTAANKAFDEGINKLGGV
jgi:hypothetical protein